MFFLSTSSVQKGVIFSVIINELNNFKSDQINKKILMSMIPNKYIELLFSSKETGGV